MQPAHDPGPTDALREALLEIAERARALAALCTRAIDLASRPPAEPSSLADGAPAGDPGSLQPRQGALLVAVTLRGGTVAADSFSALAERLEVPASAVADLFGGTEPHLVRRAAAAAGLTERGLEAAAAWRTALPPELLRAATEA